jgi:sugar-specific transcriptional regulator TrmB
MEIPLLTQGESKAYKALVELGESSIGDIIKVSGVSHSKIYDILKRLSKKGLVSSINKNGKQYFSAADPKVLSQLIDDKVSKIEEYRTTMKDIIAQLEVRKNTAKPKSVLSSYEGIKGVKYLLDQVLVEAKKGDVIRILGTPQLMNEQAGGYLKGWQQQRVKLGAVCKIISDPSATSWDLKWWKDSKKKKLSFTKRSQTDSPSYIVITKDSVLTIYFSNQILAFNVAHKEIAERYISFFERMWDEI